MLWCSLFVADLIAGMEELELHTDAEADFMSKKMRIAIIAVRMVITLLQKGEWQTESCKKLTKN